MESIVKAISTSITPATGEIQILQYGFAKFIRIIVTLSVFHDFLFQQLAILIITTFQYTHLMDGYLVKLNKTFPLCHILFDKHSI